ncbi:Pimeloyl-ACP methyl ester carboxylesterase [Geodermatophilus telluris]|uniref:Pimeloyl-ACP methyl ester carboxylesterase n=1 Tax=Geodermatophilus telluris TaxID=1190417 RepID=A0A1G6IA36_9ACTN|nr:alpha/beta hydrolase [Geodermatophilus telluris]SDC03402.1 Pimeloyl-ACP methyl ester carboxylesterase [Geodermatophilus telluris]
MTTTDLRVDEGYAPATGGVRAYWRSLGEGGTPLVALHGGFGVVEAWGGLLEQLAAHRRVVAVEPQGHGRTADVDRPFSWDALADDVAAVVAHLGLGPVDLLGYSLGGGVALRTAIRHPGAVRRLVLVSAPCRRDGWFPEVLAGMAEVGSAGFEGMRQTPMYAAYAAVAPDVDAFPALMDKTGDLLRGDYDWTEEVRGLTAPVQLVYADADGIPPSHAADFYALLGGGLRDAGWDGSGRSASRLAVLPGRTHYDVAAAPELASVVEAFLA